MFDRPMAADASTVASSAKVRVAVEGCVCPFPVSFAFQAQCIVVPSRLIDISRAMGLCMKSILRLKSDGELRAGRQWICLSSVVISRYLPVCFQLTELTDSE